MHAAMKYYFWTHNGWSSPDTAGSAIFSWVAGLVVEVELSEAAGDAVVSAFAGSADTFSAIASELVAKNPVAMIREMMARMILPF